MDLHGPKRWRDELAGRGARFDAAGDVRSFGDVETEYRAIREGASFVDRSSLESLAVSGADAARFLHGLTTGDINAMPPGTSLYTLVTDDRGRVLSDATVRRRDDRTFDLLVERGFAPRVLDWFEAHRIADRVALRIGGEAIRLELAGPRAMEALERAGVPSGVAEGSLQSWTVSETEDAVVSFARSVVVEIAAGEARGLWGRLVEAGFRPAGETAFERWRIERGRPRAGCEFDGDVLPMEVGLDDAVSFTKGCYAGQEIIARATHRGHVHRTLIGLRMAGDAAPGRKTALMDGDEPVGWITSAVAWPDAGVLALACVRREHAVPSAVLRLPEGPWAREAQVVGLPVLSGDAAPGG